MAPRGHAELLLVNGVALLLPWLPPLLGRVPPSSLGLARGTGRGWLVAAALWAGMLPFLAFAAEQPEFQATYPLLREARESWALFAVHSAAMALYFLLWEALFRGLLVSVLARRLGPAAGIALQAAAFGALHAGKPLPELLGSFVAGVALGLLALRARSFLPAAALHTACALTLDLLICAVPR